MSPLRLLLLAIPVGLMALMVAALLVFGISNMRAGNAPFPPGAPAELQMAGGLFTLTVQDGPDGSFEVRSLYRPQGGNAMLALIEPRVTIEMIEGRPGRITIPMFQRDDGSWSGTDSFPRPGRWLFRVDLDNNIVEKEHIAP